MMKGAVWASRLAAAERVRAAVCRSERPSPPSPPPPSPLLCAASLDPEMPAVSWVAGDAERLPIASDSIDLFTIAFGIRNVTRVDAALREAHRVLRPGGRFMCLEFSHVHTPVVRQAYDAVRPRARRWREGRLRGIQLQGGLRDAERCIALRP